MSAEPAPSSNDVESSEPIEDPEAEQSLSLEETVIQWTITVFVPLLITFIAFGVIILAYGEWKLY